MEHEQLFAEGGGFFNMLGGAYNAPAGYQRRLLGGIIRVKERWVLYCSSLEVASIVSLWQWLIFFLWQWLIFFLWQWLILFLSGSG